MSENYKASILDMLESQEEVLYRTLMEGLDVMQAAEIVVACEELIQSGQATRLFRVSRNGAMVHECTTFRDLPDTAHKEEISVVLRKP